jgi:type IV secretory pathway protease TraF
MALLALSLGGCAHGLMRGSVAMKTGDHEAHVCMGNQEVKVGDKVVAYKNHCTGGGRARGDFSCEKRKIGDGTITKLLNEHYSVVQFDDGVQFDEGTIVEKL